MLTPTEMTSQSGARLELQNDGSVFVHQESVPKTETYLLMFQGDLKAVKGLRLEALTDARLPSGGPGWSVGSGQFVLSEVTLEAASAQSPDQPRSIALVNASANSNENGTGSSKSD